ncbi:MAG: riboflavin synthase [Sphingomonadales bacterium]|jgi:riboflavin synthase
MFTGIITDVGEVRSIEDRGDIRMVIATHYDTASIDLGASIACSGVCLTVVEKADDWFSVDISHETLSKTNLGDWSAGTKVNLERALRVGDELGGHIVTGHVDAVGKILSIEEDGASLRFRFEVSKSVAPYIAPKGGVALNGVSLTVNDVEDTADTCIFGVNIIPHTQEQTTFHTAKAGEAVNVEIDVLARYVSRLKDVQAS